MLTHKLLSGMVLRSTRNQYMVEAAEKMFSCTMRGKIADSAEEDIVSIKVGDQVELRPISDTEAVIENIKKRKTKFSRTVEGRAYQEHVIAANIDQIVVITAARKPAFKSGLLDRFLIIAEQNSLPAAVCINKMDLADESDFLIYKNYYSRIGYPLVFTSALTGKGMDLLKNSLQNKVSLLLGQSGAGKSSLIKILVPGADLRVTAVSDRTNKGVHTTTHVEMFKLPFGGYLIDTPGIRELGLWGIYKEDLKKFFIEYDKFEENCQFKNCNHLKEPGCAVKAAVENEAIFNERYANYQNIYQSLRAAPYELIKFK